MRDPGGFREDRTCSPRAEASGRCRSHSLPACTLPIPSPDVAIASDIIRVHASRRHIAILWSSQAEAVIAAARARRVSFSGTVGILGPPSQPQPLLPPLQRQAPHSWPPKMTQQQAENELAEIGRVQVGRHHHACTHANPARPGRDTCVRMHAVRTAANAREHNKANLPASITCRDKVSVSCMRRLSCL